MVVVARLAAVVLGVAAIGACGSLRSRFPTRDEVFIPIPVSLGEMRVAGAETTYVLSGTGYEIVTPSRELLRDAKQVLDEGARRFRRYFSEDPPAVAVNVRAITRDARRSDDTSTRRPSEDASIRGDGRREVTVSVLLPERRERVGMPVMPLRIGPPVARAWLLAFADANSGKPAPTATLVGGPSLRPDDPRIPDWLEDAIPELIAPSPVQDFVLARLAENEKEIIPIRALVDSQRPANASTLGRGPVVESAPERGLPPPDSRPDPRTGRERPPRGDLRGVSRAELPTSFAASAFALAQFLAEREGPEFVGNVAERLIRGEKLSNVLLGAKVIPRDMDAVEREWRSWIDRHRRARR